MMNVAHSVRYVLQRYHQRRCATDCLTSWLPKASPETVMLKVRLACSVATEIKETVRHVPVMLNEALKAINPQNHQTVLDMTFGAGGHTQAILHLAPGARILALDRDPVAYQSAVELASTLRPGQLIPMLGRFSDLTACLKGCGVPEGSVDAVLFDVGASSMQFDDAERGFSLSRDGPLDMRMDRGRLPSQITAADVVNNLDFEDLYQIFRKYGEERRARVIAEAIIESRYAFGPITSTKQLANVISNVCQGDERHDKLHRYSHMATKTFQALRIFVNDELNELHNGLLLAHRALKPGGRCVVITFHSLEDRIAKRHFHGIDVDAKTNRSLNDYLRNPNFVHEKLEVEKVMVKRWLPVVKGATLPSFEEVSNNPRARSAKLRAAIRV